MCVYTPNRCFFSLRVLESPRRHGVLQALQTRIRDATQVGSFRWVFVAWGLVGTVAISRISPLNSG
jgi:hypothetical protein